MAINELLPTFYLEEFVSSLPMKLGTVITPQASAIPEEIKKKLFLLKAALKNPKYILIDDTFTGMNSSEINSICNFFKSKGSTIIATSSDKTLSHYFDNTVDL